MDQNTKYIVILLLVISIPALLLSKIHIDYSVFKGNRNYNVAEVYYKFPLNTFKYKKVNNKNKLNVLAKTLFIRGDTIESGKRWKLTDTRKQEKMNLRDQSFVNIKKFNLPVGKYEMVTYIKDLNSEKQFKISRNVESPEFNLDSLMVSDLSLNLSVEKTNSTNRFSRYFGYDIVPNASNIFGNNNPTIYPFCEVYNLKYKGSKNNTYQLKYYISDINGGKVKEYDWKTHKKPGNSAVILNSQGFEVDSLKTGNYIFNIAVIDNKTNDTVKVSKRFSVINKQNKPMFSQYGNFSTKELDSIFEPIKYIATSEEINKFKQLNSKSSKIKFLKRFWKQRDPDQNTNINEKRQIFKSLVKEANRKYSEPKKPGYKTDRGRILIQYGRPDDIERNTFQKNTRDYEIWSYDNVEGGVKFIFIDVMGFGRFDLIHSTARNEVQNYNWKNYIRP